jgi:hypothetical protein
MEEVGLALRAGKLNLFPEHYGTYTDSLNEMSYVIDAKVQMGSGRPSARPVGNENERQASLNYKG